MRTTSFGLKKIQNDFSPKTQTIPCFPTSLAANQRQKKRTSEEANQKETPASQAYSSVATTLGVAPAVGAQLARVWWICLATPNPRSVPR